MHIIYKYTNRENGKVYIGQTSKTIEERAQSNGKNYRECRHFYNAIQKYSWNAFIPEILETVETQEEANERERYYIELYDSMNESHGYNLYPGGDCKEMSDETKAIISQKAKERYADKTANPMYGKKHSLETIQKQREKKLGSLNPMYGTVWTDVQREKCGLPGRHPNFSEGQREALREHMRKVGETVGLRAVRCVEDDMRYDSLKLAAEAYGVAPSTLCGHLTGHQKTCKGKHFEYVN